MTIWSWSKVYGAAMDEVIAPAAIPTVNALAEQCIEGAFDLYVREKMSAPLAQTFLSVKNPATVEPYRTLLERNAAGVLPTEIPVFLSQGLKDELVRPDVTHAYMRRLCTAGSIVKMLDMPNVSHGFAGYDSADAAVGWIADRFAGRADPNDC